MLGETISLVVILVGLPLGLIFLNSYLARRAFPKGYSFYMWEYGFSLIALVLWYIISVKKGGSLSNMVIEGPLVCAIILSVPWVRVLAARYSTKNPHVFAMAVAGWAMALCIIIGLLIPGLPE